MLTSRQNQDRSRQLPSENRRGAAAVEMAVVLPIFIMALLGIIELGRGIMISQLLENAAREGARMAILDGTTNSTVQTTAQTFMHNAANISPSNVTVTVNVNGTNGGSLANAKAGDLVTITVSVAFANVSWLPPKYLSGATLSAVAAMRHE